MAKTTEEKLLDKFTEAAGHNAPDPSDALAEMRNLAVYGGMETQDRGTAEVTAVPGEQSPTARGATPVPANEPPTSNSKATGSGVTPASIAKTVLESGLGLVPLIGGLIGLFSGGGSNSPPLLTKYVMPETLDFQAADNGGSMTGVSYDQMGMPRVSDAGAVDASTATTARPAPMAANEETMDARWFMDHSADIAAAVRNAMLNLNSINDVVSEL
jgi:hypothetical protein